MESFKTITPKSGFGHLLNFHLIFIQMRLILNFLCLLALEDKGD